PCMPSLSLHDALPIWPCPRGGTFVAATAWQGAGQSDPRAYPERVGHRPDAEARPRYRHIHAERLSHRDEPPLPRPHCVLRSPPRSEEHTSELQSRENL